MRIRYIGRASYFRGKTLYEIACNLKDFGAGRVVARVTYLDRYLEKSYQRLVKVEPDMTDTSLRRGVAWGENIFRGTNLGSREIKIGMKMDWMLISKEDEDEFCKLTEADKRTDNIVPSVMDFPPLLQAWIQQNMKKKHISDGPSMLPIQIERSFTNRAKQE